MDEVEVRRDDCTLCKEELPKLRQKDISTLHRFISGTNVTLGELLLQVGWNIGPRETWKRQRCCRPCKLILTRWYNTQRSSEKINCDWRQRTGRSLPIIQKKIEQRQTKTLQERIIADIKLSKYNRAIIKMKKTVAGKKAFFNQLSKTIRKEASRLEKETGLFTVATSSDGQEYNWDEVLGKINDLAPTMYTCFHRAISRNRTAPSSIRKLFQSRLGTMFHIPLHHRKPRIHKPLSVAVGSALWRCRPRGKDKKRATKKRISTATTITTATSAATTGQELDQQVLP